MARLSIIAVAAVVVVLSSLWWLNQATTPTAARLVCQGMGVSEDTFPTIIAIQVKNLGSELPQLKSVRGKCSYSYVIAGPGDKQLIPDGFDWDVGFADVPDAMGDPESPDIIPLILDWKATDVPLDLLAIVQMSFVVEYDETKEMSTDLITFLVGNNLKVQKSISSEAFGFNADYSEVADQIEALEGYKSKKTMLLVDRLRQVTK